MALPELRVTRSTKAGLPAIAAHFRNATYSAYSRSKRRKVAAAVTGAVLRNTFSTFSPELVPDPLAGGLSEPHLAKGVLMPAGRGWAWSSTIAVHLYVQDKGDVRCVDVVGVFSGTSGRTAVAELLDAVQQGLPA